MRVSFLTCPHGLSIPAGVFITSILIGILYLFRVMFRQFIWSSSGWNHTDPSSLLYHFKEYSLFSCFILRYICLYWCSLDAGRCNEKDSLLSCILIFSSLIPRLWWWKSLMMFLLWFPWWSLPVSVDLSLTQLILASTMMASIWRHFTHSTFLFIVYSICWVWTSWSSQTLQCILICSLITD